MIEINDYLWETIYILKSIYDHDPKSSVLKSYESEAMNGDYVYEIAESAIGQFFADTREYYDEEKDLAVYVFFDPLITDFWRLCDEYEARMNLKPDKNKHRQDMERALDSALYIADYSYDARWYADTGRKNGCRLVMLCYCEFYGHHYMPKALSEAYDAFVFYTQEIRKAIAELDQPKSTEAQAARCQRKKAA